MRAVIGSLVACSVAVTAFTALAVEPAKRTVSWYRTHQQAREGVLATCQNDHTFDDNGDCRNAQSASHAALADSLAPKSGRSDPEANPGYYGRDGAMIALTLSSCARHQAPVAWCQAAQVASSNLHK